MLLFRQARKKLNLRADNYFKPLFEACFLNSFTYAVRPRSFIFFRWPWFCYTLPSPDTQCFRSRFFFAPRTPCTDHALSVHPSSTTLKPRSDSPEKVETVVMVKVRDVEDPEEASTDNSDDINTEGVAAREEPVLWPAVRVMPHRVDRKHVLVYGNRFTEATGDDRCCTGTPIDAGELEMNDR